MNPDKDGFAHAKRISRAACAALAAIVLVACGGGGGGGGAGDPKPPNDPPGSGLKPPAITSFSPTEGPAGTQVVVSGSNFSETVAGNTVRFNGVDATVLSASSTELVAVVPKGATSGPLRVVTISGGSAVSSADFTITPDPTSINWLTRTFGAGFTRTSLVHNGTRFFAGAGSSIETSPDGLVWTTVDAFGLNGTDLAWNGKLFVAVGGPYWLSTSIDGREWSNRNLPEGSSTPVAVAAGPALWVAVGENGTIVSSPDGAVWTARDSGTTSNLVDVAWAANRFVAVGSDGAVVTSPNGEAWTVLESPTTDAFTAVGGNSSLIVAATRPDVGSNSPFQLLTSTDGVSWDIATAPGLVFSIIYAGDRFLAAGSHAMTSVDGVTWQTSPSLQGALQSVVYVNDEYVGVGQDFVSKATLFASSDGLNWRIVMNAHNLLNVARSEADGRLVAAGNSHLVRTSTDNGATWTYAPVEPFQHVYDIFDVVWSPTASAFVANVRAFGPKLINAYTSVDGATWTKRGAMSCIGALAASPTGMVSVGITLTGAACVAVSDNGETWTSVTPPSVGIMRDIFWTGSQFIAVGDGGLIATSPDGSEWTVRTSNVSSNLYGSVASDSTLVAVGGAGAIVVSEDGGVTWGARSSGVSSVLRGVAFNGSEFFVVGAGNNVLTSSTGETWESHATPHKDMQDALWLQGASQWLVVGNSGLTATATPP